MLLSNRLQYLHKLLQDFGMKWLALINKDRDFSSTITEIIPNFVQLITCDQPWQAIQHAVSQSKAREVRHTIPACSGNQSLIRKATDRHAISVCTNSYKRGCKTPEQQTSWHSEIAVQLEEPEQKDQQSKQLQHLRQLGRRHEAYDCISWARWAMNWNWCLVIPLQRENLIYTIIRKTSPWISGLHQHMGNLHCHIGAVLRNLAVVWTSSQLITRGASTEFHTIIERGRSCHNTTIPTFALAS